MRKDSAKPTLIVSDNYRLFVADAYGVAEVYMPALAKSFYLMLLRHPEGVVFDDSHKARKSLLIAIMISRTLLWMMSNFVKLSS